MTQHGRFAFSPTVDRPPHAWLSVMSARQERVWRATGSEIVDAYTRQVDAGADDRP